MACRLLIRRTLYHANANRAAWSFDFSVNIDRSSLCSDLNLSLTNTIAPTSRQPV